MINLGNRKILNDGTVIFNDAGLVELLYQNESFDLVFAEPSNSVALFNRTTVLLDTAYQPISVADREQFAALDWFSHWTTPEQYTAIDIENFCYERCSTVEEIKRVQEELVLFEERNMIPVLKHLIYLVDHFRKNNIVWGVGRGSSVSSFVLFLIGINRINPLIYNLDIKEFLK